jgi:heptaprenyl diphosphate synthase
MLSRDKAAMNDAPHKAVWVLLAVAMSAAEFFFPRIPLFPWLKPGIANCVTLIWIIEFGAVDALLFFFVRAWIVGFYFGFSFLTIALSLSGGVIATLAMALCWNVFGKKVILGAIGISITGAVFHNFGQLVAVYFLMAKNIHLFYQIPVMLIASVLFGSMTGLLAPPLLSFLRNTRHSTDDLGPRTALTVAPVSARDTTASLGIVAASVALVFVNNLTVLAACAAITTVAIQALFKGSWKFLFQPVRRYWLLFLFIGCLQLFYSYGARIERLPFLTHEGVVLTLQQWLRLWTWLELSLVLTFFHFNNVVFKMLSALFSRHESTLQAGLLALEHFPATVSIVQARARKNLWRLLTHPIKSGRKGMEQMFKEIVGMIGKG